MGLIFKILLPLVLIYFAARAVLRLGRIVGILMDANKNGSSHVKKSSDQVIDICPECGRVLAPGHRCPDNS